jgi:hypothetical protein
MQVVYLVGSSMVYLTLHTPFSPVFGNKLFTDCSLRVQIAGAQSTVSGVHMDGRVAQDLKKFGRSEHVPIPPEIAGTPRIVRKEAFSFSQLTAAVDCR